MSRRILREVYMVDWAIRPSRLFAFSVVLGALAAPAPVSAQAVLAEVRDLKPRQVRVEAFQLSSTQNVRIEAVGEEGDLGDRSYTVLRTIWKGQPDQRSRPWVGNAWILDLRSRRVVWELSAAKTSGRGGAREFRGSVQLPAGSYAAYVAAFPSGSVSEGDGP